ncbi:MAG: 16S rRNA (cytidine(1402)-2'-O)-methyltransferase [Ignavibacteria bacterium]|nr:16S rRNA (cytidine(1402)-2'-O)-methyltransferase [Ignavibacteria bacterium]
MHKLPAAPGTLFIVGTPIGNPGDLSLRARETLQKADIIACEERREAIRLLKRYAIDKPLIEVNEHTEAAVSQDVITELLNGKSIALISDCGMPVFADPGTTLVQAAVGTSIPVTVVPGPTSLGAALAVAGFDVRRFYFHGFLSPKKEERRNELKTFAAFPVPIVFLDAPYRLRQVLGDLSVAFGPGRPACVACDLTMEQELVKRGSLKKLTEFFAQDETRREYVIIVDAERRRDRSATYRRSK